MTAGSGTGDGAIRFVGAVALGGNDITLTADADQAPSASNDNLTISAAGDVAFTGAQIDLGTGTLDVSAGVGTGSGQTGRITFSAATLSIKAATINLSQDEVAFPSVVPAAFTGTVRISYRRTDNDRGRENTNTVTWATDLNNLVPTDISITAANDGNNINLVTAITGKFEISDSRRPRYDGV